MIPYYLTQSNLFMNGQNTKAVVKMFEIDNLKATTEKLENLGQLFNKDVPTGYDQMAGKMSFSGPAPDFFNQAAFAFEHSSFTLLGVMVDKSLNGSTTNKQLKIEMSIRPIEVGMGKYENQKLTEYDRGFLIDKITITMAGVEQLHVDSDNNIYRVNGVDKWADYRTLLGQ